MTSAQSAHVQLAVSNDSHPVRLAKVDFGGEISIPLGMRIVGTARSFFDFELESLSFPRVPLTGNERFIDINQLTERSKMTYGAAPGTSLDIAPLMMADYLERHQILIPKRLKGKYILFIEVMFEDAAGKKYIRALKYDNRHKVWVRDMIPVYGASFWREMHVVAKCKIYFKNSGNKTKVYVDPSHAK